MIHFNFLKIIIFLRNFLSVLIAVLVITWIWANQYELELKKFIELSLLVVGLFIAFCQFLKMLLGGELMTKQAKRYNNSNTFDNRMRLKQAKEAITNAKTETSLSILSDINTPSVSKLITLLSARYAKLKEDSLLGILSHNKENIVLNRLNKDILGLILTFESELKSTTLFEDRVRKNLKKRNSERLSQKLANRQPINLRQLPTTEGTSKDTSETFVTINNEDIQDHIAKTFHAAYGRLLITGKPGAGKTTLLLQLELALLDSETDNLPVLLNLATWKKEFITLEVWLKEILHAELGTEKKNTENILQQNCFILLLDGLDEIKEYDRQSCLEAIGRYRESNNSQYVITSRIAEYKKVAKDAPVNLQIEVGDLTFEQMETELDRIGYTQAEAIPFRNAIHKNALLREAAQTPFYFNTLQLLFAGGKTLSDLNLKGTTATDIQTEIILRFVEYEFAIVISDKNYTAKNAQEWLSFLAFSMSKHNKIVFELADLNYDWYPYPFSERQLFVVNFINSLFLSFTCSLVGGLAFGLVSGLALGLVFGLLGSQIQEKGFHIETRSSIRWSWFLYFQFIQKSFIISISISFLILLFIYIFSNIFRDLKQDLDFNFFHWLFDMSYLILLFIFVVALLLGLAEYLHKESRDIIQIDNPYQRFKSSIKMLNFSIFQHWHLMYMLSKKSLLPFKLVPFLKAMVKHKILESDGATWRFRHKILQDYFATLDFTSDFYFYYNKIKIYRGFGDPIKTKEYMQKALKYYNIAIKKESKNGTLYNNIGVLFLELGEIEVAKYFFEKAILLGELSFANLNLGHVYLCRGDKRNAIQCYKTSFIHFYDEKAFMAGMQYDLKHLKQYGITEEYYNSVLDELRKSVS